MVLEGQCSDIHLTLNAVSEVGAAIELSTPQFRSASADWSQSSVEVVCNINSVATAGVFQRQCVARDTETDAKTLCHYKVHVASKSRAHHVRAQYSIDLK